MEVCHCHTGLPQVILVCHKSYWSATSHTGFPKVILVFQKSYWFQPKSYWFATSHTGFNPSHTGLPQKKKLCHKKETMPQVTLVCQKSYWFGPKSYWFAKSHTGLDPSHTGFPKVIHTAAFIRNSIFFVRPSVSLNLERALRLSGFLISEFVVFLWGSGGPQLLFPICLTTGVQMLPESSRFSYGDSVVKVPCLGSLA